MSVGVCNLDLHSVAAGIFSSVCLQGCRINFNGKSCARLLQYVNNLRVTNSCSNGQCGAEIVCRGAAANCCSDHFHVAFPDAIDQHREKTFLPDGNPKAI